MTHSYPVNPQHSNFLPGHCRIFGQGPGLSGNTRLRCRWQLSRYTESVGGTNHLQKVRFNITIKLIISIVQHDYISKGWVVLPEQRFKSFNYISDSWVSQE